MDKKPIEDVIFELNNFKELGGKTIVDATGSSSIGRDIRKLKQVAELTGINVVASSGLYIEKFEGKRLADDIDAMAK